MEEEEAPLSGLLEQQPNTQLGIIRVDEQPDGSIIVEPSDDAGKPTSYSRKRILVTTIGPGQNSHNI